MARCHLSRPWPAFCSVGKDSSRVTSEFAKLCCLLGNSYPFSRPNDDTPSSQSIDFVTLASDEHLSSAEQTEMSFWCLALCYENVFSSGQKESASCPVLWTANKEVIKSTAEVCCKARPCKCLHQLGISVCESSIWTNNSAFSFGDFIWAVARVPVHSREEQSSAPLTLWPWSSPWLSWALVTSSVRKGWSQSQCHLLRPTVTILLSAYTEKQGEVWVVWISSQCGVTWG